MAIKWWHVLLRSFRANKTGKPLMIGIQYAYICIPLITKLSCFIRCDLICWAVSHRHICIRKQEKCSTIRKLQILINTNAYQYLINWYFLSSFGLVALACNSGTDSLKHGIHPSNAHNTFWWCAASASTFTLSIRSNCFLELLESYEANILKGPGVVTIVLWPVFHSAYSMPYGPVSNRDESTKSQKHKASFKEL